MENVRKVRSQRIDKGIGLEVRFEAFVLYMSSRIGRRDQAKRGAGDGIEVIWTKGFQWAQVSKSNTR